MADLLLVDNDRRILDLATWFLERRGHAVRAALSYREARVLLDERMPDLLLADLELGEENGREELPRLEREGLLPRTMIVSGYLDAGLEAELRRLPPVVGALAKPYPMHALETRIAECLAEPVPVAARVLESQGATRAAAEVRGKRDPAKHEAAAERGARPPGPRPTAFEAPSSDRASTGGTDSRVGDAAAEDDEGWVEIVPFRRDPGDEG